MCIYPQGVYSRVVSNRRRFFPLSYCSNTAAKSSFSMPHVHGALFILELFVSFTFSATLSWVSESFPPLLKSLWLSDVDVLPL